MAYSGSSESAIIEIASKMINMEGDMTEQTGLLEEIRDNTSGGGGGGGVDPQTVEDIKSNTDTMLTNQATINTKMDDIISNQTDLEAINEDIETNTMNALTLLQDIKDNTSGGSSGGSSLNNINNYATAVEQGKAFMMFHEDSQSDDEFYISIRTGNEALYISDLNITMITTPTNTPSRLKVKCGYSSVVIAGTEDGINLNPSLANDENRYRLFLNVIPNFSLLTEVFDFYQTLSSKDFEYKLDHYIKVEPNSNFIIYIDKSTNFKKRFSFKYYFR